MIECIPWDGKPISQPGIYSRVPMSAYHSANICIGPSISSTHMRIVDRSSPAHLFAVWPGNPNRAEQKESEAMNLGSAVHWLAAHEPHFDSQFVIKPKQFRGAPWNGNRKDCIAELKRWKRDGLIVLTEEQIERVIGMAKALGMNPLVQEGILGGLKERSIFWIDKETGLWRKARPDAIPTASGDYSDLKTTTSTLYLDLQRTIGEFSYHMQGATILTGARAIDLPAETFSLVFVESAAPFCTRVVQLRDEDIERGEKQNRAALRIIADCISSGSWPGPGDDRADCEWIDLPLWRREQIDEKLKLQMREAA